MQFLSTYLHRRRSRRSRRMSRPCDDCRNRRVAFDSLEDRRLLAIGSFFSSVYQQVDVGTPPGVPTSFGGLTIKAGDPNTLLIGGSANNSSGRIYSIGVTRDASNHITGFTGTATALGFGAYNDGGLAYDPTGVLFYTKYPNNEIGQVKPGANADTKVTSLTSLGANSSVGGLAFVPAGMPGAGQLKTISWSGGYWYTVTTTPDGAGAYNLTSATFNVQLSGGPEGIAYVPSGSALFPNPSVLIAEYSAGAVGAYQVDANGNPIAATRKDLVTGLSGAEGAAIDPLTGDFLFSTFGGSTRVVVVRGFQTPASISGSVFNDADNNGVKAVGESGMAGWTVYIDANSNAQLDSGEISVVTSATGAYSFTGLNPGTYRVRQVPQAHWSQTTPGASFVDVTVTAGQTGVGPVFGDYFNPPTVQFQATTATPSEASGTINLAIQLAYASDSTITVPFTVSGTATGSGVDYSIAASPITINAGATSANIALTINNDTLAEANETVIVTLGTPTGATLGTNTSTTVTIVDNEDAFQVTSFSSTATGFVAQLNRAIDQSVLNLYDQAAEFGAADVTLVGVSGGGVTGSLVVNSTGKTLTFIATGGSLVPDSYTATIFSSAMAAHDTTTNLLDGNLDGIAGGNSVNSFTISAPAANQVTVSIPDVTRGYGQTINLPASATSGIPITISKAQSIKSVSFSLVFDPALLSVTGATLAGSGVSGVVSLNTAMPGVAQVTVSNTTELSSSPGSTTLMYLLADVPVSAPYAAKHVLDITNLHVLDTSPTPLQLPSTDDDGIHIAAYFGDANGSQTYNSPDATFVQRIIVGTDTGLSAYQLADPYLIVDASGNGQVQSDDVTQIQRAIVGLSTAQIPPHPGLGPAASGGPDPIISIPKNLTASVGEIITVPVQLLVTEPTGITLAGADIAIAHDASTLEFTDAEVGQLLIGFGLSVNTSTPGLVRLTLGGSPLDLDYYTSGVLATLRFTVIAGGGTTSHINLLQSSASQQTALYDAAGRSLTLSPAPTNSDDDEVDGLISILRNDLRGAAWEVPVVDMALDSDDDFTTELIP